MGDLFGVIFGVLLIGIFLVMPPLTSVFELVLLFVEGVRVSKNEHYQQWYEKHKKIKRMAEVYGRIGWLFEIIMYFTCFLFEYLYLELAREVIMNADWTQQLYNRQLHQPFNPEFKVGAIVIVIMFFAGMTILYLTDVNKTPPLITSVAISTLYIGSIYSFVWTIHIISVNLLDVMLLLLPVNTVLISLRLIIRKTGEYMPNPRRMSKIEGSPFLSKMQAIKMKSAYIPIFGLILVIPVIGIMVVVLVLFGQAPDAAIKAFTETSDFLLSTKASPQNLYQDEHYLCTVAAGGDRKLVKPIRRGLRHGHEVIVNRQLQVANAFEEELMIHTPKLHRKVRDFYDTYGFPVAKAIKKNWIADLVYFIMKPLEYLFVIVLYAVEVHPEDRIAMQYTGTNLDAFRCKNNIR